MSGYSTSDRSSIPPDGYTLNVDESEEAAELLKADGSDAWLKCAGLSWGNSLAWTFGVADRGGGVKRVASTFDIETPAVFLLGKKVSINSSAPSSPGTGDIWLELVGSTPRHGWFWHWNGSYWLSPDQFLRLSLSGASTAQAAIMPVQSTMDLYFKELRISANTSVNQTGTNYWSFNLLRTTDTLTETSIASQNLSQSSGVITQYSSTINTHVDTSAVNAFQVSLEARITNSPGTITGAAEVVFQYARP